MRLTPEQDRALSELAAAQGLSKQEATVRAIEDAVARSRHTARVADSAAKMSGRYADLIERLGR